MSDELAPDGLPGCYLLRNCLLDELEDRALLRKDYLELVTSTCHTAILERIRQGIETDARGNVPMRVRKIFMMTERACRSTLR